MTLSELRPDNIIAIGVLPVKVVDTDPVTRMVTIQRRQLRLKEDLSLLMPLPITHKSLLYGLHFKADDLSDCLSLYTKQTDTYQAAIVQTIHQTWLLSLTDPQTHDTVRLPVNAIHEIQNAITDFIP